MDEVIHSRKNQLRPWEEGGKQLQATEKRESIITEEGLVCVEWGVVSLSTINCKVLLLNNMHSMTCVVALVSYIVTINAKASLLIICTLCFVLCQ